MIEFREISESAEDLLVLERFYEDLYVSEFPDADERESLANMKEYLRLRAQGWYGRNNYHVLVALDGGRPCGGAISDFLADAGAGVIEFLVVGREARGSGLGQALLKRTQDLLAEDARATGNDLQYVVAEMNDPFKPGALDDCFDPFVRASIWDRWGFGRLDFPYLQPALSTSQRAVSHLMLIAKAISAPVRDAIPASAMKQILADYMRWAMRIEAPESTPEYQQATGYLAGSSEVPIVSLGAYVGKLAALPMSVRAIARASDASLDAVLAVYASAFPSGPSEISPEALRQALVKSRTPDVRYHLWAVSERSGGPVEGMASFFTFPEAGFGGYVALTGALRGTGRLALLLARIEEQMLRDRLNARGWYIECATAHEALFRKMGFHKVDLEYRQPPLERDVPLAEAPILCLMYKPFGRSFAVPEISSEEFMRAMRAIFRHVYEVAEPDNSSCYRHLVQQTKSGIRLI